MRRVQGQGHRARAEGAPGADRRSAPATACTARTCPASRTSSCPGRRLAIFVHGCFWHGHDCARGARVPKANRDYWVGKVARNRARDDAQPRGAGGAGLAGRDDLGVRAEGRGGASRQPRRSSGRLTERRRRSAATGATLRRRGARKPVPAAVVIMLEPQSTWRGPAASEMRSTPRPPRLRHPGFDGGGALSNPAGDRRPRRDGRGSALVGVVGDPPLRTISIAAGLLVHHVLFDRAGDRRPAPRQPANRRERVAAAGHESSQPAGNPPIAKLRPGQSPISAADVRGRALPSASVAASSPGPRSTNLKSPPVPALTPTWSFTLSKCMPACDQEQKRN